MSTQGAKSGARKNPKSAVWRKRTAVVSRWLHIYLSMISFGVVLFFSATGLTLNHADKLSGHDRVARYSGTISAPAMHVGGGEPDTVAIAKELRQNDNIRGSITDTRIESDQVSLSFKGAGYTADAYIDRPSGKYQVVETRAGAVSTLNDLHRGVVTGKAWSWVIDVSAVLLVLVSLTGLVLLFFVYKRRISGFVVGVIGVAVIWMIARLWAM